MLDRIIRFKCGHTLGPQHGAAQLGDGCVIVFQLVDDLDQGMAGIRQIVNQQHFASDFAFGGGDKTCDIQVALLRTSFGAVRAGGHDGQRFVKNARQDITRTHAAASQTQNSVELPARLVNFDGEFFNQIVVLVIAHVQVFAVFCQHCLSFINSFFISKYHQIYYYFYSRSGTKYAGYSHI